ncbi:MAG: hypothetical protein A3K90_09780 [Pelodictyon luteolum]|uniref:Uncharacterized protein n=1 Tax=Pelodictyon luteolum TaxID=1100 RepID=A0A165M731_PELLU|nr:DUF190 domain-containing protein [Pelodictyon luteolum]KZK74891.1 MAG: hypothetical protein A3K90_09780 [Pelodictyon luteolum]
MMEFRNSEMLRIFLGEEIRLGHRPLYEEVVREARLQGMAGATVLKGVLSFGHDMEIHTAKIMEFAANLPMVVDICDTPQKIDTFLPVLEQMVRDSGGRVMVSRAAVRSSIIG